jgi:hypothetical protein
LFDDPSLVAVRFPSSVAYEREIRALARERPDDVGGRARRQAGFELFAPMQAVG